MLLLQLLPPPAVREYVLSRHEQPPPLPSEKSAYQITTHGRTTRERKRKKQETQFLTIYDTVWVLLSSPVQSSCIVIQIYDIIHRHPIVSPCHPLRCQFLPRVVVYSLLIEVFRGHRHSGGERAMNIIICRQLDTVHDFEWVSCSRTQIDDKGLVILVFWGCCHYYWVCV